MKQTWKVKGDYFWDVTLPLLICFRGERHRAARWFLPGRRRVVRGSQVAAWDRGTSWLGDVLCVALLGPIFWILLY